MNEDVIRQWADAISPILANVQNESLATFEHHFAGYQANITWACTIHVDKGDYWTAPSWWSDNETLSIDVIDEEGDSRPEIASILHKFLI